MDTEDLRSLLRDAGVDLWTLIESAIATAARDHGDELLARRDGIVELLYARAAPPPPLCRNCDTGDTAPPRAIVRSNNARVEEEKGSSSPAAAAGAKQHRSPPTPQSMSRDDRDRAAAEEAEEEEEDEEEGEDRSPDSTAKSKILAIKEFLDLEDQSEDQVVSLLQNLADLEVTFRALRETDIGRHVNGLRKHPSGEVRRLVKLLVRKWKDIVAEWVKSDETEEAGGGGNEDPRLLNHGKSNGHHQVPDFGYSPIPHNGGSSERAEAKAKAPVVVRREPVAPLPVKQGQGTPVSASQTKVREAKDNLMDAERLAAARRRLQENYQEAQNAKKQRTIQVMDIHEIPKAKNTFTARGRGGGSHHQQAKHW